MPGHFTHIYTARRVADHLITGQFPDWPQAGSSLLKHDPKTCGTIMRKWEKFTAIGAIGPDLFYFSQDYNGLPLGPASDELMLTLATYYFFDAAKENDWEPLLIILDQVNATLAALLRFLIKLQKIWQQFVDGWNQTIGPIVADIQNLADALTGGLLSEFGVVLEELKLALKTIAEEELLTYADIFNNFNTCVQKGFDEKLFLWSDISHYRRPSALCQAFVKEASDLAAAGQTERSEQFLAFALGYITHLGTDTVAHSFVNEQCGGPFRNHPQRHHLIENHIDAWNYSQTGPGGAIVPDPWGHTATYPDASMSALWFAVQMTPDEPDGPHGKQRPDPLPDDPTARKKALDVDGEMPDWMANSIVNAMMNTFTDPNEHPHIFQGDGFQSTIDGGLLTKVIEKVTGSGPDRPFPELLKDIAPPPPFPVRNGFPLPWQVKTIYKIMITFYRLSFNGTWELEKPRKPDFIIFPPASDIENLLQPPDLSGIDPSNPVDDICGLFIALVQWAIKNIDASLKLVEDLIKMLASPASYPLRLGLYELAMLVWDVVMKTHEVLAHTGFVTPHAEQHYPDGELRLPDEIDAPLITLGGTVDAAFRAALAAAFDPLGNLDKDPDVIGIGHSVSDLNYPYYPVLRYHTDGSVEGWEFHRPWAWPDQSRAEVKGGKDTLKDTPPERYDPNASFGEGPPGAYKPLRPGPYAPMTMPNVFFRLDAPVDAETRTAYEQAQTPFETDQLNLQHLNPRTLGVSPLGDPIPFSAHLIGQLVNNPDYSTQFNLDSDRAFAYLTWDWIRNDPKAPGGSATGIFGLTYATPKEPPREAPGWAKGANALLLEYKDPPDQHQPSPPPPPPPLK
ncbi:MAG: zinc dependent phospholipase C family protein [Acidobacteriota bacterium]|nr:zinc dependent phospholipase C family protein [Acidobacteriota bacterium]